MAMNQFTFYSEVISCPKSADDDFVIFIERRAPLFEELAETFIGIKETKSQMVKWNVMIAGNDKDRHGEGFKKFPRE